MLLHQNLKIFLSSEDCLISINYKRIYHLAFALGDVFATKPGGEFQSNRDHDATVGGNYLFYKIKGTKYKVKPYDIPQRAFNPHKISLGSRGSTCITFHK